MKWWNNGIINRRSETPPEGREWVPGYLSHHHVRRQSSSYYDRKLASEVKRLDLKKKLKTIDQLVSVGTEDVDVILSEVKSGMPDLDEALLAVITEKVLLHQLTVMPAFFSTITESIRDLYKRVPALQQRNSYCEFLVSSISTVP